MIIVPISGGLGNQMFQYAFSIELGRVRRKIYTTDYLIKRDYAHNGYELKTIFNLDLKTNIYIDMLIRLIRKLLIFRKWHIVKVAFRLMELCGVDLYEEKECSGLDLTYLTNGHRTKVLLGYWQSEYFFKNSMDKIQTMYRFNHSLLSIKTKEVLYKITHTQSVAIHIRRGDYLSEANKGGIGSVCTLKYYNRAINLITDKIVDPFFYVFSDDIQWARENIRIPNMEFISWNKKEDSWQDMFLMSECKHNIIANSTFSWWGAWLNRNINKIVVAPSGFLYPDDGGVNIYPSNWIKL